MDSWQAQYARERARLMEGLGAIASGGVIEDLAHIGATSVPGSPAQPCVDIGIAIWPFPLEARDLAFLASLGYAPIPESLGRHQMRLRHRSGATQLLLFEAGREGWTDYRLITAYLRHNALAREDYAARKSALAVQFGSLSDEYLSGKTAVIAAMLEPARHWWMAHHGFAPVQTVADELKGYSQAWRISGGWALDLFLNRITRVHHDVDVVIARASQPALASHLSTRGWVMMSPVDGRFRPWSEAEHLNPRNTQLFAFRDGAFIDFQLTDIEHGLWRYRRLPAIVRAAERIDLVGPNGMPFLAPELVLLFKSQNTTGSERPKDQLDYEAVQARLEPERRAWLLWALVATDPKHRWIASLAASGRTV